MTERQLPSICTYDKDGACTFPVNTCQLPSLARRDKRGRHSNGKINCAAGFMSPEVRGIVQEQCTDGNLNGKYNKGPQIAIRKVLMFIRRR